MRAWRSSSAHDRRSSSWPASSERLGERCYLVHSGQHYDDSLSLSFLETYDLPVPEIKLEGVGGASRGHQFAAILDQLTERFTARTDRPRSSCRATRTRPARRAQAASFLDIPVVHVEAGLRSYDRAMPEEINRQLVGVVAELHCAPTELAAATTSP